MIFACNGVVILTDFSASTSIAIIRLIFLECAWFGSYKLRVGREAIEARYEVKFRCSKS